MENEKRIATSNAEMVTISRAEYESQQTQLTELKLQNQWLLEQLGLAKKRQFGSSSEKLQEGLMDQLSLSFNELEAYAYGTKSATPEQVAVKAHARKKQSGSVTEIVPEGTPTEVVEHRLSEEELICSACGSKMEEIGKEVRRSLQMEPARFWIRDLLYLRLQEVRAGQRRGQHPENTEGACAAARQLCFRGGGSAYCGTEVCDVFPAVPAGAGVSPPGIEALPADHVQLAAECL